MTKPCETVWVEEQLQNVARDMGRRMAKMKRELREEDERRRRQEKEMRRSETARMVEEYLKDRETQSQERERDLVGSQMPRLRRQAWVEDEGRGRQEEEKRRPGKSEEMERIQVLLTRSMDDRMTALRVELREEDEGRRSKEEERSRNEIAKMVNKCLEERGERSQEREKDLLIRELDQRMSRLNVELREEEKGRRIETARMMKEREVKSQKMEQMQLENMMAVMIRELDQRVKRLRTELREEDEGRRGETAKMSDIAVQCPSRELATSDQRPSQTSGGIFARLKKMWSEFKMRQQEKKEKRKARQEEEKQKKKEEKDRKQKEKEQKEMKPLEKHRKKNENFLTFMKYMDMVDSKEKEEKDRREMEKHKGKMAVKYREKTEDMKKWKEEEEMKKARGEEEKEKQKEEKEKDDEKGETGKEGRNSKIRRRICW